MTSNPAIKNIIFDLGGVLLNLNYSLTSSAFQKLSPEFSSFDAVYSEQQHKHLFENFEKGTITPQQFRNGICSCVQKNIADSLIDEAWNKMLLDFPKERVELLEKLKKHYRLFLLSNTNKIHIEAYSQKLKDNFGFTNLSHIFEQEYYSYNLGMRKPDPEIFQFVLSTNKLMPSATLFIDDSPQHIQTASSIGIYTLLLEKGMVLDKELDKIGLLG